MIGLLRTELTRMVWRRAVLVLVGAALLIPLVIAVGVAIDTNPPSDAEIASAEQQAARESERKVYQRQLQRCLENPDRHLPPAAQLPDDFPTETQAACEEWVLPQPEWYTYWTDLSLIEQRDAGAGVAVFVVVTLLMLLAGTTFAGHDWASGSVGNQLLFEPRRIRVWAAKALAITLLTFAVAATVLTAFWLGLAWLAHTRDLPSPDGVLLDCLQAGWRGAAIAAGAALGGYALTMLFRSTVAALGILLAFGLAGGLILAAIGIESVWNPGLNLLAILLDGAKYEVEVACPGGGCYEERTLTLTRGALFSGTLLAACAAVSLASFRQRDVN